MRGAGEVRTATPLQRCRGVRGRTVERVSKCWAAEAAGGQERGGCGARHPFTRLRSLDGGLGRGERRGQAPERCIGQSNAKPHGGVMWRRERRARRKQRRLVPRAACGQRCARLRHLRDSHACFHGHCQGHTTTGGGTVLPMRDVPLKSELRRRRRRGAFRGGGEGAQGRLEGPRAT